MKNEKSLVRSAKEQDNIMVVTKAEQIELLKQTYAKGASDIEFKMLFAVAQRVGADPFRKEIYLIPFWDTEARRMGRTPVVGIDWYRKQAGKSQNYAGQGETEFGPDANTNGCVHPEWAITPIFNHKFSQPIRVKCFWTEVAKISKEGSAVSNWKSMPHTMLAKCSEAQGIRKAFPEEVGGVYIEEEIIPAQSYIEAEPVKTNIQAVEALPEVDTLKIDHLKFLLETCNKTVEVFLGYLKKDSLSDLTDQEVDTWITKFEKEIEAQLITVVKEVEDKTKEMEEEVSLVIDTLGGEVVEEMPEPIKKEVKKGIGYEQAKDKAEELKNKSRKA